MERIKLMLVDDHQLVRTGIANLLSGEPGFEIVGEAADAESFFELVRNAQPDIAILDIALPGLSGIEIIKRLHNDYPSVRVLILSMHTSEEFIFNSINSGARGYLPKNTTRKELVDAIYAISRGEEYFAESIFNVILKSYIKKTEAQPPEIEQSEGLLSKRENEVLKLFAEGQTNQEIASHLYISIRTVESHKNHIMAKLGLNTTVDLVKFAIRNSIIEL